MISLASNLSWPHLDGSANVVWFNCCLLGLLVLSAVNFWINWWITCYRTAQLEHLIFSLCGSSIIQQATLVLFIYIVIVIGFPKAARENNSLFRGTLKASPCITFTNIPLAKINHMIKLTLGVTKHLKLYDKVS